MKMSNVKDRTSEALVEKMKTDPENARSQYIEWVTSCRCHFVVRILTFNYPWRCASYLKHVMRMQVVLSSVLVQITKLS